MQLLPFGISCRLLLKSRLLHTQQECSHLTHIRFPEYKSKDNKISIWTESYGGHYGPSFAEFFESQNDLITSGELPAPATPLYLDTLGIVNGCVDILTQIPAFPQMAYNNTYDLKLINATAFQSAVDSFPACQNVTLECRALAAAEDPQAMGNNTDVNAACAKAFEYCFETMWSAYAYSGVCTSYSLLQNRRPNSTLAEECFRHCPIGNFFVSTTMGSRIPKLSRSSK